MGRRNTDGFEEFGHEMEIILGGVQELAVLSNLIRTTLAPDNATENTETYLL